MNGLTFLWILVVVAGVGLFLVGLIDLFAARSRWFWLMLLIGIVLMVVGVVCGAVISGG